MKINKILLVIVAIPALILFYERYVKSYQTSDAVLHPYGFTGGIL